VSYRIRVESSADRDLKHLPEKVAQRVDRKLDELAENPLPRGAIKLKGYADTVWRVRVGDYRIVYTINTEEKLVKVFGVLPRPKAYRR